MNAQFRSQPFATPPLPPFLPATRLLHHPTLHLAMSDMTLPDLLLAVNPSIWTFHTWKTRTGNMLPPFDELATSATTGLESWQLVIIKRLAGTIHSLPSWDDRILYIQHLHKFNHELRHALDIWNTWVNIHLKAWNIQGEIEEILEQFGRHPSQMHNLLIRTRLVSCFLSTFFSLQSLSNSSGYLP